MQRVVLTGGPGAGKTAVLQALAAKGYATGEDAPRSIIRERKDAGLSPRPDELSFAEEIFQREVDAYRSTSQSPTFFERGVVDAAGFLYSAGGLDDDEVARLIADYPYEEIFIFPPWEDIYCTDEERDQTFEHALAVYDSTLNLYQRVGYHPIEVPLLSVTNRTRFVLDTLAAKHGSPTG